jgi:iron(III) transport system substrate-binding protein
MEPNSVRTTTLPRRQLLGRGLRVSAGLLAFASAACNSPVPSAPSASTGAASSTPSRTAAPAAAASAVPSPAAAPSAVSAASGGAQASPAAVDDSALANAARQEGGLTFYTVNPDSTNNLLTQTFKDRYDIDIQIVRLVTNPLDQRFAAEAQADHVTADVLVTTDAIFMADAVDRGWIAHVPSLPALGGWPAQFWNGAAAVVQISRYGFVWNTNLVKAGDEPHTWKDVADPKWQGQVLMADPRNSIGTMAFFSFLRDTYGDDLLRDVAKLQPRLSDSLLGGTQQIGAGTNALFFPTVPTNVSDLIAQKAPVRDFYPEQTTGSQIVAGVATKAPHPNAARLLLNFMLTMDGQRVLNQGTTAILPGVPGATPLPPQYVAPDLGKASSTSDQILSLLAIT